MIEVKNLEKYYGDKHALKGISFSVQPGEILGFLGPNGAGKSTTVKILTGLIPATQGEAKICGYSLAQDPIEVKKHIGYVPESGALYESLTAWEYLELVADLHHLKTELFQRRATEFLELFGLTGERDSRISGFSKGMRQKILISAAMLHNPPVLLFDEPLNGVDANTAMVFKQLLRRFSEQGKTILFCSHVLEVVERLCTRIIIINEGTIVADGTPKSIAHQTGHRTLEAAFNAITGGADADSKAEEFLMALEGLKE
ncbi:MAG: ABC transporter ATP-binding protein [Calditrichaeota bacterium]|nr:MAG: ABC transporter ATP-binding protein [Calditrichota bacterium]